METKPFEATEDLMTSTYHRLKTNFRGGELATVSFRRAMLQKLKQLVRQHEPEINLALKKDLGMNDFYSYFTNTLAMYGEIDYFLDNLDCWTKPKRLDTPLLAFPACGYELNEPLGMVLVIGAWNYPIATTLLPMVAAIAAGNCVVVKPSEQAPESSKVMAKIVATLDSRFYAPVEGGVETAKFLNKQPFDLIVFTGGTQTGRFVLQDAANNLSKVCLELGGKNPTVVDSSANVDLAAKRIVNMKFMNCGQTCISPDLLYVHDSVKESFTAALVRHLQTIYGNDAKASHDYGRIVNGRQTKRVLGYLEGQEAKVIYQAGTSAPEERFVPPTLLMGANKDASVMREETFGPILPISPFADFNEVMNDIATHDKPLAMYYFGDVKSENYKRLRDGTSSGSLVANDVGIGYVYFTGGFGGVGSSGMGKIRGYEGFKYCSHQKIVVERSRSPFMDLPLRYAPSSAANLRQLRFVGEMIVGKTFEAVFNKVKLAFGVLFTALALYFLISREILVINLK